MKEKVADSLKNRVSALENRLSGILRPITPRREFIHGLSKRIAGGQRGVFVDKVANLHLIAILVAGFISLVVFMAIVARALVSVSRKKRTAGVSET